LRQEKWQVSIVFPSSECVSTFSRKNTQQLYCSLLLLLKTWKGLVFKHGVFSLHYSKVKAKMPHFSGALAEISYPFQRPWIVCIGGYIIEPVQCGLWCREVRTNHRWVWVSFFKLNRSQPKIFWPSPTHWGWHVTQPLIDTQHGKFITVWEQL